MTEKEQIELIDAQIAELKKRRSALTARKSVYSGPFFQQLTKDRDAQAIQNAMSSLVRSVFGLKSTNRQELSSKDCNNLAQIIEDISQVLCIETNFDAANEIPALTNEEIKDICCEKGYLTEISKILQHVDGRAYKAISWYTHIITVLEFLQLSDGEIRKIKNCGRRTSNILISTRNQIAAALENE